MSTFFIFYIIFVIISLIITSIVIGLIKLHYVSIETGGPVKLPLLSYIWMIIKSLIPFIGFIFLIYQWASIIPETSSFSDRILNDEHERYVSYLACEEVRYRTGIRTIKNKILAKKF